MTVKLILIRGLPGSGKSTLAQYLEPKFTHVETDQYFMDNGRYVFDASQIKVAHEWCQNRTLRLLKECAQIRMPNMWSGVVVSNTFTQRWELEPYFDMAKQMNIIPQLITCYGDYGSDHDVPEDVLTKMKARFEHEIRI